MDTDDSGTISLDEFKSVMARYPDAQGVDIERLYKAMDPGGSGEVECEPGGCYTSRHHTSPHAVTHRHTPSHTVIHC